MAAADTSAELASAEPSSGEELRAAALRGVRWTSVGRFTVEVSLLASMVILARLIPPAEFGPYAVAVVAQELVVGIQSQGLGNALVQRPNARREHVQSGLALMLASSVALAVLMLVCARVIVEPIFGAPTASLVTLMAPLAIISGLGIVPTATLRRRLEFRRLTTIDMLSTVFRVGGAIGLAAAGLGAKSLVYGTLAAAAVATLAAWISAPPPLPRLHRRATRELLEYGLPASLASISWTGFRNCDYAIIGARVGTTQAGLYFRAYQLAVEYQKKVADVVGIVAFPVLARSSSAEELSELRGKVVRLLTVMIFPLLTLLAIVAPVFIPWLLGPAWQATVVPTQILALGGAATLVIDTAGVQLAAGGRSRAMLGFGVGHFVAYAAVVWVVAPHGIAAVAIAAAVVHTVFLLVSYGVMLWGSQSRPLRHIWADVAPATVASIALAAVAVPISFALSAAHAPVLLQVMVVSLAGGAAYLLALRTGFQQAWRELVSSMRRMLPLEKLPGLGRLPSLAGARSAG
jgi:PST family polysaccharide transporter